MILGLTFLMCLFIKLYSFKKGHNTFVFLISAYCYMFQVLVIIVGALSNYLSTVCCLENEIILINSMLQELIEFIASIIYIFKNLLISQQNIPITFNIKAKIKYCIKYN